LELNDQEFEKEFRICIDEKMSSSVNRRSSSYVELDETRGILKGFVPIWNRSGVMAILLDFRPLAGY